MALPLNPEQRAAVEYLEGPLLVLAGPGTGKTQLLSAKVAYILEHTDANASNILCLTFTEAGATNMRDRLQSMIGKAAEDVNIYTYHAFGKNILDRYQNYAETTARKLETAIDDTTRHKIISDLQKTLPATDILRHAEVGDIVETISQAKAARLTASDLARIAEQNLADGADLAAAASGLLAGAPKGARYAVAVETVYQPLLERLVELTSPTPIVGNIERLANTLARELHQILDQTAADPKPSTKLLREWRDKIFERDDTGDYRLKDRIANKKLVSLAQIMSAYDAYLSDHGLFDFDDMIEQAIHYLKTDTGFRLSLSELFQYVLLDEFQDTNVSQFELIKLLTAYDQPVIMAVGDDDQAIYAFQGANASNLMEFREHYHAKIITLVKNYRSAGEVLGLSRHIADQIADSFANSYAEVDKQLTAMRGQVPAKLARHEFPCADAEYYWVAKAIRRLLDAGTSPTEIAILAPKHKYLVAILPYLKAEHIDIAYEKRENLLEDEQMGAIITLARFVFELASGQQPSHRLPEILSYDFWQIPPAAVLDLFTDRYATKPTLELLRSHDDFAPLAQFFAALAAKSFTAPLELWLDYLIGVVPLDDYTSPFLAYYQAHFSDAELLEFYENLATFRQTILTHATNLGGEITTPKLADFITTLDDFEAAGTGIMRISGYRDAGQAVQVMTAFKSKGLEFQHVFLISLDDHAWGKGKGNNNKLALPRNLLPIRHTGVTADEKLRLLFVAMTRAKDTLTMTNAVQNAAGKRLGRLSFLSESSFEADEQLSPYLPASTQAIEQHHDDLSDAEKISALRLGWVAHYQKYTAALEPILATRVENYRLSASDLTGFIDLIYAGPQAIYRRVVLHEPPSPSTPEQLYGTLIHQVFEQITSTGLSDAAALELFRSTVPRTSLEPNDQADLLEAGIHNLDLALRSFGEILRHQHAKAEVNLASEHLSFDGVPLTGKIDLLKLDPEAKTIEVYDYKTSKNHSGNWNSDPTLYKYRLQLGFYKLLLNLSPTYRNYRVTRGHILFVTPDADDQVFDRAYDYNDADEAELKALLAAVYHQIHSLAFVKDPDVFVPADKSNTMPRIRAFVAELLEKSQKSEF